MNSNVLLARLAINRAVVFGLASRLWQLLAGPVTAVLVTSLFSDELQGYYYTFAGLLAFQAFVELGLHAIVIYFVSHEWSRLHLDKTGNITGDPKALARLVSFGRQLFYWYGGAAAAFALIGSPAGLVFFWPGEAGFSWIPQWLMLVAITSISLWLIPFLSILEGCNQVETVNRFRFWVVIAGNAAVWISILTGAELWTIVASAAVRVVGELLLLFVVYRQFFHTFLKPCGHSNFSWKKEVWPMQWRSAVQSVTGYFGLAFVTPVIFRYHGASLAGQMGLTWSLLVVVQGIGQAWIQPRVPTIGMLISKRDFTELNQVFRQSLVVSTGIVALGIFAFAGFVWGATAWENEIAKTWLPHSIGNIITNLREGVIDPISILIFGSGIVCSHIATCIGIYVRAHRHDPLVILSTFSSGLLGLLIYFLGRYFSVQGAAIAYCSVYMLIAIPGHVVVLQRVVKELHHSETAQSGPVISVDDR